MTEVLANPGSPSQRRKYGAPATDVCVLCSKTVYPVEKLTADNKILHKACLKCGHCKKTLSLGNYASLNGTFYCKPHFKQLFALKGNYTDGFVASAQSSPTPNNSNESDRQESSSPARNGDGSPRSLADRLHAYQSEVSKAQTETSRQPSRDNTRDFSSEGLTQYSRQQDSRDNTSEKQSDEIEKLRRQVDSEVRSRKQAESENETLKQQLSSKDDEIEELRQQVQELKAKLSQGQDNGQESAEIDRKDDEEEESNGNDQEWN